MSEGGGNSAGGASGGSGAARPKPTISLSFAPAAVQKLQEQKKAAAQSNFRIQEEEKKADRRVVEGPLSSALLSDLASNKVRMCVCARA